MYKNNDPGIQTDHKAGRRWILDYLIVERSSRVYGLFFFHPRLLARETVQLA